MKLPFVQCKTVARQVLQSPGREKVVEVTLREARSVPAFRKECRHRQGAVTGNKQLASKFVEPVRKIVGRAGDDMQAVFCTMNDFKSLAGLRPERLCRSCPRRRRLPADRSGERRALSKARGRRKLQQAHGVFQLRSQRRHTKA